MIPRRILLTVMTIFLLLPTFAYSNPDSTGTRNDTVAIEVLEERVKGNAEKMQIQIEALQKLLVAQNEAVNQRITDLDEASQRQTSIILWMAGFFLTLSIAVVTFFGHRAITGWIKQSISKRTEKLIKQHKDELATQTKNAKAEWAKAVKAREEYENSKKRMEKKAKEIAPKEPTPAAPDAMTPEFQDKLEAVKDESEYTARDWFFLGYEADERGEFEEAVRCYTESTNLDPSLTESYINRGNTLNTLQRYDEALKALNVAIELDPENSPAHNNRGNSLLHLGRCDEALADYDKAIKLAPLYSAAYINRGNTLNTLQRYDEALKSFNKAIKLDPNNSPAYNNRGYTLNTLQRYDEALADYDKAIDLDPTDAVAYNNRGNSLLNLGRYNEALADYDKAIELDPKGTLALQNAAEAMILFGDCDDALLKVSKALDLSKTSNDKAKSLYLKCIAEKLTGKDTSVSEGELDRILKEDFVTTWSFDEIEGWLEKADISEETREFIKAKTAMLKAKKKKQ